MSAPRRLLGRLSTKFVKFLKPAVVPSASPWLTELVVDDADDYIAALVADLEAAATSIDLEVYILADDPVGQRVLAVLAAAAARGLVVRLMVDGVGSATWVATRARALTEQGVEVAVYHPTPSDVLALNGFTVRWILRALGSLRHLNRRNHRKVCVVDGRLAWVGSINLEYRHCRSVCGKDAWRDVAARVEGDGVAMLVQAFALSWRHAWRVGPRGLRPALAWRDEHVRHDVGAPVRLNHGLRMRRRLFRDLLRRIRTAERRVWLANAYFVPHPALLAALIEAAQAGREVRLLLTARSDVWFMPAVADAFLPMLVRAGVQVSLYHASVLHAKTVMIDDWATVGSTNLNSRSLRHDLEADVVLTRRESIAALEDVWARDLACSTAVSPDHAEPRWLRWLVGRTFLLMRRWL